MSVIADSSILSPYFENNYKVVNRKCGCKVTPPMSEPTPTKGQLDSNIEKAIEETSELSYSGKLLLDAIQLSSDQVQEEIAENIEAMQEVNLE